MTAGFVTDLTGQRFGRLVALSRHREPGSRVTFYTCKCDCGRTKKMRHGNLKLAVSCGCYIAELSSALKTTHGQTRTPTYRSWRAMRYRCLVPSSKDYHKYGARGIGVCERWATYENFVADMGLRPRGTSIERLNNDGDYEPTNCVWATPVEQSNNKRNNRIIEHLGQRQTLAQWAREIGISPQTLSYRLNNGWRLGLALTTGGASR